MMTLKELEAVPFGGHVIWVRESRFDTCKLISFDASVRKAKIRPLDNHTIIYTVSWDDLLLTETDIDGRIVAPQAMRFNQGKPQWSLVDFSCFEDMVRVLEFGTKKYDRDNWKKGLPMRAQCESMMRHLIALMNGEVNDPETGLPHWSHIQCNTMFMDHTMKHHHEKFNDLPTIGVPGPDTSIKNGSSGDPVLGS